MENWDPFSALTTQDKVFGSTADGKPAVHFDLSYHIENERYVAFLETYARQLGAEVLDDLVQHVSQDDHGVTGLLLKSGRTETADLYVDSSGFRSELLGKRFNEPFISFKTSLYNNRAVVGGWMRADANDPIEPYTTCKTMNAGWCWRIDHEDRVNRGYVFSSDFISDHDAEAAFRAKNPRVTETHPSSSTIRRTARAASGHTGCSTRSSRSRWPATQRY